MKVYQSLHMNYDQPGGRTLKKGDCILCKPTPTCKSHKTMSVIVKFLEFYRI